MLLINCLLITKDDKQLVKTVGKLFKLQNVDGIYPSKCPIVKHFSMFYSKIENNVLQPSNRSMPLSYKSDPH